MFGSIIIDTALGLVLVYTFLSLICMAINEAIAASFALRAKTLKKALVSMINDKDLVDKIYNSPIIFGLWQSSPVLPTRSKSEALAAAEIAAGKTPDMQNGACYSEMLRPPSYLPPKQVARAVIDMLNTNIDLAVKGSLQLSDTINSLPSGPLKDALLSMAAHAQGDAEKFRIALENWFDDAMDRVTGWYKRKMQFIGFGVALVVTLICNADTFQIASSLYHDSAVRSTLATSAVDFVRTQNQLSSGELPVGWAIAGSVPATFGGWIGKIIGWLLTAVALTMGAPFWFDILNKFVNVRLVGKKPGDDKDTGNKGNEQVVLKAGG